MAAERIRWRAPAKPIRARQCRVEVAGAPAQRVQRRIEQGRRHGFDARDDARERGGDGTAGGARVHRHLARQCAKAASPRALALGQRDAGRNRRVPAERHFGLGAEVADVVGTVLARDDERGLGVAELRRDLLHADVAQSARVQDHAGGVAAGGVVGEGGVAQDRGHAAIVAGPRAGVGVAATTGARGITSWAVAEAASGRSGRSAAIPAAIPAAGKRTTAASTAAASTTARRSATRAGGRPAPCWSP